MIPGKKILILGEPGSGKTSSLRSLPQILPGKIISLITEPMGLEIIQDLTNSDPAKCKIHTNYIPPLKPDFDLLIKNAKLTNLLNFQQMTQQKGGTKIAFQQFLTLLESLNNFTCETCKTHIGNLSALSNQDAIIIDSITGINLMILDNIAGDKPTLHMGERGIAALQEEKLIVTLCSLNANVLILAHILEEKRAEKIENETIYLPTGKYLPGFLGQILPQRINRFFSDVILCKQTGKEFSFSTLDQRLKLKARNFPLSENFPARFTPENFPPKADPLTPSSSGEIS